MNKVIHALEKYNQSLKDRVNLPFLKYPTIKIGKIQGGTGVTLVPDYCEIEFDHQVFPTEDITVNFKKYFNQNPTYSSFNGYSEVELLASNGIPSVIFGPGDIALAHASNENVPIQEVIDATKIYALIAYNYTRKSGKIEKV